MEPNFQPAGAVSGGEATLQAVARVLLASDRVLVTMHRSPDGDALGSALGLALALEDSGRQAVVLADGVPGALRFLPGAERVVRKLEPEARFDATVACDSGDLSRLPEALPAAEARGIFVNLDHHATTPHFGDLNLIEPKAASVGVLVFKILREMGAQLGPEAASALYVSLLTDTGGFRYANSSPEAFRIAAELVELGARPGELASAIWENNPPARLKLLEKVLPTLELHFGGKAALMTVTAQAVREAGTPEEPADGLVSYPRSLSGVEISALLREEPHGNWRVSLRSRGRFDVAKIATAFGGGGHSAAAGFTLKAPGEQVRSQLLSQIAVALAG